MYQEKIEGGTCSCGGTFVKNPKTDKIFCDRKCWLNNQAPQTPNQAQNAPTVNSTPNLGTVAPSNTNDNIRQNVALKMVSELIASGHIPLKDWNTWATKFYNYNPEEISLEEPPFEEPVTPNF